jgi:hypothetical protein
MFGFWMKNRSGTLQPLGKRDFEFWIFDVGWKRKNRGGTLQPLGKKRFWILDFGCWMEEEEQERDAPATGGREILDFGFWILDGREGRNAEAGRARRKTLRRVSEAGGRSFGGRRAEFR